MAKSKRKLKALAEAKRLAPTTARHDESAWQPVLAELHSTDLRRLAENFSQLMASRAEILAWQPWRDIVVDGCHCSIAYSAGGGSFRLGYLLDTWAAGELTVPGVEPGEIGYVYTAHGSPLSGAGGTYALAPERLLVRRIGGPSVCLQAAMALAARKGAPTVWDLTRLLIHWGLTAADVEIRDERELIGRYRHGTSTLQDACEREIDRFVFPLPGDEIGSPGEVSRAMLIGDPDVRECRLGLVKRQGRRAPRRVTFSDTLPDVVVAAVARWLQREQLL